MTFIEGDMFTTDISPATVVTLYLSESLNLDLEPKLRNELRRGRASSRISSAWAVGSRIETRLSMARSCSLGRCRWAD